MMEGRYVYDSIINTADKKHSLPQYYYEEPPIAELGFCEKCGKVEILGSKLCKKCWDKALGSKSAKGKLYRIAKGLEQGGIPRKRNVVTKKTNRAGWSKGLTKYDHPGIMAMSLKNKGRRKYPEYD